MRNYFSKTLLAFVMALLVYFSINSAAFIKDREAYTALATFIAIFCTILYSYYSSNINQLGNE